MEKVGFRVFIIDGNTMPEGICLVVGPADYDSNNCLCARSEIVERYRLFYRYKKEKVKQVFQILGSDQSEEDFINTFKRLYPEDWQKILELPVYHKQ